MNITSGTMKNKFKLSIIFLFLIIFTFQVAKSNPRDTTFRIMIEAGGGYGLSTDTLTRAGSRYGISGLFRIMVKTDHRLRFGVETGWLHVASFENNSVTNEFGTSKMEATLKAMPVMLVFCMDLWGFSLYTGLGYYQVISSIEAFGEKLSYTRWNQGFYLSLAYRYEISKKFTLLPEVKWCSIGELGKTLLSAQIGLSYNLFEW